MCVVGGVYVYMVEGQHSNSHTSPQQSSVVFQTHETHDASPFNPIPPASRDDFLEP
jgi:hypothetical protein